jgi:outer membrane protein OmpA-like peptidoglycan-associated protein
MKYILLFVFSIFISVKASAQSTIIVYFDSDKSEVKNNSIKSLDSIVHLVQVKSNYQISIKGHCDATGNKESNQLLSEQRAESIYAYFKNKNFKTENISLEGLSINNPIADNETETGKAKNRRAEITIKFREAVFTESEKEKPLATLEKKSNTTPFEKPKTLDEKSTIEDLETGKILILKNLNFVGGTSSLLKESEPSLNLVLKLLNENPTVEIEIEGHVCCANDMALSIDRALTVLEFLVKNGINENRLKYAGHSYNNPIANEQTEEGRKQNRRVEIMILKK